CSRSTAVSSTARSRCPCFVGSHHRSPPLSRRSRDARPPARPRGGAVRSRGGAPRGASRVVRATRNRSRGAPLPAKRVPRARLHALEQLLVRGPLQLRHLQPPLLPARRPPRDQAPRRRD